jgi:hypothetical protein
MICDTQDDKIHKYVIPLSNYCLISDRRVFEMKFAQEAMYDGLNPNTVFCFARYRLSALLLVLHHATA